MPHRWSWALLLLLVLALLLGTLMPGAWRSGVMQTLHAPPGLTSLAHLLIFAALTLVLATRPLRWPFLRIALLAIALALLTEGLQFFASERHPRWLDVGIDLAGVLLGMGLLKLVKLWSARP